MRDGRAGVFFTVGDKHSHFRRSALLFEDLLQFAGLIHLADDVAAADELAPGPRRPGDPPGDKGVLELADDPAALGPMTLA
jgi:hypothetical protein